MERKMKAAAHMAAALLALPLIGAASPLTLDISVNGLRSEKGLIQICLFRTPAGFPDCTGNADAIKRSLPAHEGMTATIEGLTAGDYAVALIHDENGNGKLDTRMGIPSEGIGFSRNPRFFFGPPKFKAAQFQAEQDITTEVIRVKYFL